MQGSEVVECKSTVQFLQRLNEPISLRETRNGCRRRDLEANWSRLDRCGMEQIDGLTTMTVLSVEGTLHLKLMNSCAFGYPSIRIDRPTIWNFR
jgi:hypothetical protein